MEKKKMEKKKIGSIKFDLWTIFRKKKDIALGIGIDEIAEYEKRFDIFLHKCEKQFTAIQEKTRKEKIIQLEKILERKEQEYQKSRDMREPYSTRKNIAEMLVMGKEMLKRIHSAKCLPVDTWIMPEDIPEIQKQGFETFYQRNFLRSYETNN